MQGREEVAELQGLPYNETPSLRYLIEDPDIAIPLLANYDDAILEKDIIISQLKKDNDNLKHELEEAKFKKTNFNEQLSEEMQLIQRVKFNQMFKQQQTDYDQLQHEFLALQKENYTHLSTIDRLKVVEQSLLNQVEQLNSKLQSSIAEYDRYKSETRP